MPSRFSSLAAAVALLAGLALAGCEPAEKVEHYRETRPDVLRAEEFGGGPSTAAGMPAAGMPAAVLSAADGGEMIAAIVARGPQLWFFKLAGPVDAVAEHAKDFARFVTSLGFGDDPNSPPTWTLPNGWQAQGASGMRFDTLVIADSDPPLEVTVTKLPRPAEGDDEAILANVNRWRRQMGLPPGSN